jgi:hypothetical protein
MSPIERSLVLAAALTGVASRPARSVANMPDRRPRGLSESEPMCCSAAAATRSLFSLSASKAASA